MYSARYTASTEFISAHCVFYDQTIIWFANIIGIIITQQCGLRKYLGKSYGGVHITGVINIMLIHRTPRISELNGLPPPVYSPPSIVPPCTRLLRVVHITTSRTLSNCCCTRHWNTCCWIFNCGSSSGWLEPLLDRIKRNPTTVVCPVIDSIEDSTFRYRTHRGPSISVGGFSWKLVVSIIIIVIVKSRHQKCLSKHPRKPSQLLLFSVYTIHVWPIQHK